MRLQCSASALAPLVTDARMLGVDPTLQRARMDQSLSVILHVLADPEPATSLAKWDHTFAVNVRASAFLSAAALPDMQRRGFGRIMNVDSERGVAIVLAWRLTASVGTRSAR